MEYQANGLYEVIVPDTGVGTRYKFSIDGQGPFPDPASRYQPYGVHGPSEVIDGSKFPWMNASFHAPTLRDLVLYELHLGAFTQQGTFLSAIERLDTLRDLGITAIEIMPVADFPGERNWGYDGVAIYAPSRSYGMPDEMRMLVDAAHQRDLAVYLDVVYNHLGPDGAYHAVLAPQFYSAKHKTPWGDGLNFDDFDSYLVREFFIDNALYWIHEFNIDGLRCDATHAISDTNKLHILAELTSRVHDAAAEMGRPVKMIAEDDRNDRKVVTGVDDGGLGFDAVWSDDFHHHMRRRLAGDSDGYFADFDGNAEHIATTVKDGWFFQGEYSRHVTHERGSSPEGLAAETRVFCLQNHDQIGNRALGERLSTQISHAAYRAATALLLLSPEVPLLFMGQEWAADEPFLYFTDHEEPLGHQVTEGRRREFAHFTAFSDNDSIEKIPDPQARETFLRSKLDWNSLTLPEHAACWRWYRALLKLRRELTAHSAQCDVKHIDGASFLLRWSNTDGVTSAVIVLEASSQILQEDLRDHQLWMTSEDEDFCLDRNPVAWDVHAGSLQFMRAGAAILRQSTTHNQISGALG